MKKKGGKLSLFLGLVLILSALLVSALCYLPAGVLSAMPFAPEARAFVISSLSIVATEKGMLGFASFLGITGLLFLIFRRRKPFSMLLMPLLAFCYITILVYFHLRTGTGTPEALMRHVDPEKKTLVLICFILEAVLVLVLSRVFAMMDRMWRKKQDFRRRKAEHEGLIPTKEEEEKRAEEEKEERRQARLEAMEAKEERRLERKKAREERKKEEAKRKEEERFEKEYQRFHAREERERIREEEKDRRKAEKAKRKETPDAEESESFTVKKESISPSDELDFPEFGSIPELDSLQSAKEKEAEHAPIQSDILREVKEDLEANETREEKVHYDLSQKHTFKKGGMLEATLEALMDANQQSPSSPNTNPIIGLEEKKAEKPRSNSSFAPSNLSPDHPRYRLFQALSNPPEPVVTRFPSKSFEGDDEPRRDSYSSTFIKEEKKPVIKEETGAVSYMPGIPMKEEAPKPSYQRPSESVMARSSFAPVPESRPSVEARQKEAPDFADCPSSSGTAVETKREEEPYEAPQEEKKQEIEFLYSVGIGGLSSNETGFSSIYQRSRIPYSAPPVALLVDYPQESMEIDEYTREQGRIIVDCLHQYRTEVMLDNIIKGPTVTMFELKLHEGVPVSKVKQRQDELEYNLCQKIRILAPVPGRQAVGIEVPNKKRATIGFKDMVYAFQNMSDHDRCRVPMILGKNITGKPIVIDVAKMPHILVAGTTGSGKSVCINAFVSSVLYFRSPREVRFIMVDPKIVELSIYNGIPHLLTPVITDEPKRVVKALRWLCDEMERRYKVLSNFSVRNIEGLNEKISKEGIACEKMPYIVLIMDEFADLMAVMGKDIEGYIARLVAKARAAGIHLVLATQRPSAEVVTGTIKNNFPARISFLASSAMNSRIILDESGAENLLGRGDMLFMNPASTSLERIQGAFLSDDEVMAITDYAKKHGTTDYLEEDIFEEDDPKDEEEADDDPAAEYLDDDSDEALYEKAKEIVYERKMASASYLQRRMKIGYNRAARIIEMMEERGIIGPQQGSKPREILKYE